MDLRNQCLNLMKKSLKNYVVSLPQPVKVSIWAGDSPTTQKTLAFVFHRWCCDRRHPRGWKKYCITYQSKKVTGMHIISILFGCSINLIQWFLNFQRNVVSSSLKCESTKKTSKIDSKLTKISKINSKLTRNLKNFESIFEFFVNGRWSHYKTNNNSSGQLLAAPDRSKNWKFSILHKARRGSKKPLRAWLFFRVTLWPQ